MGTGVGLNDDFAKGVFDRFRSLPIARVAPLVGAVLGDAVRYLTSIVILMVTGFILGFRFENGVGNGLLACLLVLGFALSLCWVVGLARADDEDRPGRPGHRVPGDVPADLRQQRSSSRPSTLPGFLQSWTKVNPITYLVDAMRGLMLGGDIQKPLLITLAWMVGLVESSAPGHPRLPPPHVTPETQERRRLQ